jgi:fibronectin-binding autotransporter adhesin
MFSRGVTLPVFRSPAMRSHLVAPALAAAFVVGLGLAAPAQYTWVGGHSSGGDPPWNNAANWNPNTSFPNTATATVTFDAGGLASSNKVNITGSVQAQSVSFTNPTGAYVLLSSPGQTLSGLTAITIGSGVTGAETITLANIASGSLLFGSSLTITNNAALGSSPTLVIGPSTVIGTPGIGGLTVAGSGFTRISGTFADFSGPDNAVTAGLIKTGAGRLELTGNNVNLSALDNGNVSVTVSGGTLAINADAALGMAGQVLKLDVNSVTVGGLEFLNTGVTVARPVTLNTATRVVSNGADASTITGLISGAGVLVKDGTGTLMLSNGSNSYSGGTQVSGGTLSVATDGVLGGAASGLTLSGGTLEATGTFASARGVTITGGGGTVSVDPGAALTLSGALSGASSLTKVGTGALTLTGTGSNILSLTVNAGSLTVGSGSLTLTAANTPFTVVGGSANALTVSGGAIVTTTSTAIGSYVTIDGASTTAIVTGAGSQLNVGNSLFVGPIGNGSALTVQGGGSIAVGQDLIVGFFGGSAGTLLIQSRGAVTSNAGYVGFLAGATGSATVTGAGSAWNVANQLHLGDNNGSAGGTGQLMVANGGIVAVTGTTTLGTSASSITVNGGTLTIGSLTALTGVTPSIFLSDPAGGPPALTVGTDNSSTTYAGAIADAAGGPGTVVKVGAGTLTLSGAVTATGGVAVNAGVVKLGAANVLAGAAVSVNVNGGLDTGGLPAAVLGGLAGTGNANLGATALTVGGANTSTAYSGALTGTGSLTKVGTGAWTLTGSGSSVNSLTVATGVVTVGSGSLTLTDLSNSLTVGGGSAATLTISGGATVTAAATGFGTTLIDGPAGTAAVVTGTGSQLHSDYLFAGLNGNGSLTVQNGGTVTNTALVNIGINSGSIGAMTVTGTGSRLTTVGLLTGTDGSGSLTVQNSASVGCTGNFFVGSTAVGGATAVIQSGGTVACDSVSIADGLGTTGTMTVTGAGSRLTVTDYVSVGFGVTAVANLTVQNGGSVSANYFEVGDRSTGSLLIQSGGTVVATGRLSVGSGTGGVGTLLIQSGGKATSSIGKIGEDGGATAVATVTGTGSAWTINGALMWSAGTTGQLSVTSGGAVTVAGTTSFLTSTGSLTVDGGTLTTGSLRADSGTASSIALTDRAGGTALTVGSDNTSTTYAGSISDAAGGPGTLAKVGTGTLLLSGHLSNTGGYKVTSGTVEFGGAVVQPGFGSLTAVAGTTMKYDAGARVFGGFLDGLGTHVLNGATLTGVTTTTSATVNLAGPATVTNFTNNGSLTAPAGIGVILTWNNGTNTSAGRMTVGGTALVTGFVSNGVLTVSPGGTVANSATSLVLGGGSRTFLGSAATHGGTLNLGGQTLELNGALLVNNGTISNGTVNVNFGSLAKGSGTYGPINVTDGGQFSPGNSPGTVTTGNTTWGAGGSYLWEINDAGGTAGTNWDQWSVAGSLAISSGATVNSQFTVTLDTLTASNVPGLALSFDPTQSYQWPIAQATGGITGFNAADFALDKTGFSNPTNGGLFGLALSPDGQTLSVTFTPVPEPGTLALTSAAALGFGWLVRGRRR